MPRSQLPGDQLPGDLAAMVEPYRTCEFATVTKAGVPIAWPTVALYDETSRAFTVTTSIALPVKALNVRREPRVSLLFSDPTGSGAADLPQVLVRGRASCPDEVVSEPTGLEDYWARLYERQPAGRIYGANAITRRLMDWYYLRLVITVAVQSVDVRDPLVAAGTMPRVTVAGGGAAARTAAELPHYLSGVLSWMGADGAPSSTRVRPTVESDGRLALGQDLELHPGAASLLCHSHDNELWSQRSFVTVGRLEHVGERWTFVCERFIEGASNRPLRLLRMFRDARSTAHRYLERRGLSRPAVAWDAFAALHHGRR